MTVASLATTGNGSHLYAASYKSGIYVTPLSAPTPPEPIPSPPVLFSPIANEVVPQLYDGWTFEWQSVPGAQGYQIYVIGSSAIYALVNALTIAPHYRDISEGGYVNPSGWTWKVRAQNGDGVWGEWSEVGEFYVAPR
jgi:hypothetical protein